MPEPEQPSDDPSVADDCRLYRRILPDQVARDDRQPSQLLENHPGYRLVSFTAEFLRSLQQGLIRSPTPDEPAHGGVTGSKPYSVRKKMSQEACWENGSHDTS